MTVRVGRHLRRGPRGKIGPVRQYDRGNPITFKAPIRGGTIEYSPRTQQEYEESKELVDWMNGRAVQKPGVDVARHLHRDGLLQPSLAAELTRLRTILEKEVDFGSNSVLIDYSTVGADYPYRWNDARVLSVLGYSDPYRGSVWSVQITPNYTAENQREIAAYVRKHEDDIVETLRRIGKRTRRERGSRVAFYETHPGLTVRKDAGRGVEGLHPEDG